MSHQYTPEEVKDVKERQMKALAYLKELNLVPSAQLLVANIDMQDVFGIQCKPYLQDTKYEEAPSPYIEQ